MPARSPLPPGLLALARLQAGTLSREQILGHGCPRRTLDRLVGDGVWQRMGRGLVYCGATEIPWLASAWGGVLIGGDHARLGGDAAAFLHTLRPTPPTTITVLVPSSGAAPRPLNPWSFHRERVGARQPLTRGAPPRISVEDTVLDLCDDPDPEVAIGWVTSAVQSRLTNAARLRRAVHARRYVPHRHLLGELLDDVDAGVRSTLELSYLHDVEQAHGLPPGRRQVRRSGTEADVLYEEFALLVELDGKLGHEGNGRFRDLTRDNRAVTEGLTTLRYGSRDVRGRPCVVAVQVGSVLTMRGWTGLLTRCTRCRRVA